MHPMLNIAVRAARAAGDVIVRQMDQLDSVRVRDKGQYDFVTEVDRASEDTIIHHLRKSFPDHAFLAEESGQQGESDHLWIIDPLDGTTNFIHGFPYFCVSIALQRQGKLDQAVIYNPISQDLYTASRGSGAWLNNRRIRVSNRVGLDGSLLSTGIPTHNTDRLNTHQKSQQDFALRVAAIRCNGAAALDLACVAAGQLDGFWHANLKPWDIAAGSLLIKEAGGLTGEFDGGTNSMESGQIVAGNPKVFQAMLRTINPHNKSKGNNS